jgi:hypothetical protein
MKEEFLTWIFRFFHIFFHLIFSVFFFFYALIFLKKNLEFRFTLLRDNRVLLIWFNVMSRIFKYAYTYYLICNNSGNFFYIIYMDVPFIFTH